MDRNGQIESWKNLVGCLPGVLNAEFVLEGDSIREVHILADQSRGPKQIVRDVQSALLARYQLELDHRIISVAQVSGSLFNDAAHAARGEGRRLVCERLELSGSRADASATICLSLDGETYTGKAQCDLSLPGRMWAIAQATVEALNLLLAANCRFSLEQVRRAAIGDRQAVLVGLRLKYNGKAEEFLGACYEGEDPNFSVALATLDGVNRRFPTLPHAKENPSFSS